MGVTPLRRPACLAVISLRLTRHLGDLHGVERRALAQIVGDDPHRQAVLDRDVLADARDEGGVLAGRLDRRDVAAVLALVDDQAARRLAQDVARLVGRDRLLELDVDRFRMADEHRHAHAGRRQLDLRVEDLLGLGHHLPLFLRVAVLHEDVDMRDDVEGDALGELLRPRPDR